MKDSTVSARVENNIKNEAEEILQKLGVPVSVVINSLYRQIIYHHGVPFSLTVPADPKTIDTISKTEFNAFSIAISRLLLVKGVQSKMYLPIWKGVLSN